MSLINGYVTIISTGFCVVEVISASDEDDFMNKICMRIPQFIGKYVLINIDATSTNNRTSIYTKLGDINSVSISCTPFTIKVGILDLKNKQIRKLKMNFDTDRDELVYLFDKLEKCYTQKLADVIVDYLQDMINDIADIKPRIKDI